VSTAFIRFGPQILEQAFKACPITIVIFPVGEVANVALVFVNQKARQVIMEKRVNWME
jgi:hypothetical protein